MEILFVHQAFPGQFIHLIERLAKDNSHHIFGLGIETPKVLLPNNCRYIQYPLSRANTPNIHPLVIETESKVIRGEACGCAALELKEREALSPDLIISHPGWGESLFLKDIWPNAKLITYQEFFYHAYGFDLNFDPELQKKGSLADASKARMKNGNSLLNLHMSDWCITPTQFQLSSFPKEYQNRISVIHDGINTKQAKPNPKLKQVVLPSGITLQREQPIITFVNRCIEPYRGCHTLIRSIPLIQQAIPDAQVVIVGSQTGVSYGARCPEGEWKDRFLSEIEGQYKPEQVYFTGSAPYELYLQLLQISSVHVYLTYPFVMSWSLLEAMSCGCAVVGSSTPPVMEVLEDGINGRLVDFFSPQQLAERVEELITDRAQAKRLGEKARQTILERYERSHCVDQQVALLALVASGALSA